jgi:hypothetical protein
LFGKAKMFKFCLGMDMQAMHMWWKGKLREGLPHDRPRSADYQQQILVLAHFVCCLSFSRVCKPFSVAQQAQDYLQEHVSLKGFAVYIY